MVKTCKKCGEIKELELFAKGAKYADGRRGTCKSCHAAYMKKYYENNYDQVLKNRRLNGKSDPNWKRHKITEEHFSSMISLFDGKCHACKVNDAVNIDHDHNCCETSRSCGKCVRGVLCHHCNSALGLLKDDREKILKLLKYVDSF